jgi:hypothetical protein
MQVLAKKPQRSARDEVPSLHPAAKKLINWKVFDDLDSFSTLEDRISALGDENAKAVGDALEIFVEAYLATQPIAQCKQTWLVGQIPTTILVPAPGFFRNANARSQLAYVPRSVAE